jgi:hypothetical protein
MKCLAYWIKSSFGHTLHPECHGCANKVGLNQPVNGETKVPPQFTEKCLLRKEPISRVLN